MVISFAALPPAFGQDHQHPQPSQLSPAAQHQHEHTAAPGFFTPRDASGTAWLPLNTEMYGLHGRVGQWELMWHGNAFLQFLHEEANEHRGSTQAGSINWAMGMARRQLGPGRLGWRAMFSLEPATVGGCGYPDLLATGEQCDGDSIHDRQHQHDFLMEIAGEYERPLRGGLRWQLYGGLAGEPALGPVAYPHRLSAMPNPLAPIGHHWLDASHITFGVVTTGVFTSRWKAEASLFNGREPDENRWDLDLAALDSFSGRVSFAPSDDVVLQVSAAHLNEAEAEEGSLARIDVDRVTASVTYHRRVGLQNLWASTLAWGRNEEAGAGSHAILLESSLARAERDVWFGRFEIAGKSAHDLDIHELNESELLTVGKLQAGYTRYLASAAGLRLGVGGHLSAAFVPETLKPHYGSRANLGVGFFLTVRPAAMMHGAERVAAPAGHMEQATPAAARPPAPSGAGRVPTPRDAARASLLPAPALDIAVLKCNTPVDSKTAPRMLHQGRMYYFCSEQERAAFAKDPSSYALVPGDGAPEHKH